jgi:metal-responsive CopG/Arc/MetJ family transcriptional regulator
MKTAISLPDDLFASADRLAQRLGVTRSALFATAVAEFIAKHRTRELTARLDAVYAEADSHVARPLQRAQARSVRAETPDGW